MIRNLLSMSMSWYVVFGTFLMTMQLGQTAHQRDIVDHATAVGADTLAKTLCADARDYGGTPLGVYAGERARGESGGRAAARAGRAA